MGQLDFSVQTGIKVLFVFGFLWALSNASTVLFPVIISVVLAFILNPLVEFLVQCRLYPMKRTIPRTVAVFITFMVALLVAVLVISFVLLPFAHEFERFAVNLPGYITQTREMVIRLQESANQVEMPETIHDIIDAGMSNAASYSVDVGRRFLSGTIGVASRIIDLVVVPVLTFYFLQDWMAIRETFVNLVPSQQRGRFRQIIVEIGTVISGYIRGQVAVSVIVGFLVFVGLYFFKVNYALTLGLIAALTEFIPIIGPIIGSIPSLLIATLISPVLGLKVAIFYLLIHQLENHIIVPKIMGHSIDLHPVTVILAFLVGAQLFGLAGMILAVPVAAILKVILNHTWKVS